MDQEDDADDNDKYLDKVEKFSEFRIVVDEFKEEQKKKEEESEEEKANTKKEK